MNKNMERCGRMILVLSLFCYCVLTWDISVIDLIYRGFVGLIGIAFICYIVPLRPQKSALLLEVLSIFAALYFASILPDRFAGIWSNSSIVNRIASTIFCPVNTFAGIIAGILAVLCIPILYAVFKFVCLLIFSPPFWALTKDVISDLRAFFHRGIIKRIRNGGLIIFVSAILGLVLLWGACSLPRQAIVANVARSAKIFSEEGSYPTLYGWCQSDLDNFTDAIMLLEASYDFNGNSLQRALLAPGGVYNNMADPCERLIKYFEEKVPFDNESTYARYWHGYHVFLDPLLLAFDYGSIRIINGIAQAAVLVCLILLMWKYGMRGYIIPYLLTYCVLMPVTLAYSMQFSPCYYISSFGAMLVVLLNKMKNEDVILLVFLWIGIITAYFDFLTYPLATLGIPLVFFLAMNQNCNPAKNCSMIIKIGLYWICGYVGMWALKWILATVFTEQNVIQEAFSAILLRTSNTDWTGKGVSKMDTIRINWIVFSNTPFSILCEVFVCVLLYHWERYLHKSDKFKLMLSLKIFLPYGIVALFPSVWYFFATNHSFIHSSFTNKLNWISILSVLFGLITVIQRIRAVSSNEEMFLT